MGEQNLSEKLEEGFLPSVLEPAPGLYEVEELANWMGCDREVLETILFGEASEEPEGACCDEGNSRLRAVDHLLAPAGWKTIGQVAERFGLTTSAAGRLARAGGSRGKLKAYPRHVPPGTRKISSDVFFDPKHFPPIEIQIGEGDLEVSHIAVESGKSPEVVNSYIHLENVPTRQRQKDLGEIVACVDIKWGAQAATILKELRPLPEDSKQITHLQMSVELANKYGVPVNPQGIYKKLAAIVDKVELYADDGNVVAVMTSAQAEVIRQKYHRLLAPHYPAVNAQICADKNSTSHLHPPEPNPTPSEFAKILGVTPPVTKNADAVPNPNIAKRRSIRHRLSNAPIDPNVILPGRVQIGDLPYVDNIVTEPHILRYPPINNLEYILGIEATILAAAIKYYPGLERDYDLPQHIGYDSERETIVTSRRANAVLCGIFTENLGKEKSIRIPAHWSILNGIAEVVYRRHFPKSRPAPNDATVKKIINLLDVHAKQSYEGFENHITQVRYILMPNATREKMIFCSPRLARELLEDSVSNNRLIDKINKIT